MQRYDNEFVYFITDGEYTKVGFSKHPDQRLLELQTGNPKKLWSLGTIPGNIAVERHLHRRFKSHRKKGEWFLHIETKALEIIARQQPEINQPFIWLDMTQGWTTSGELAGLYGQSILDDNEMIQLGFDPQKDKRRWLTQTKGLLFACPEALKFLQGQETNTNIIWICCGPSDWCNAVSNIKKQNLPDAAIGCPDLKSLKALAHIQWPKTKKLKFYNMVMPPKYQNLARDILNKYGQVSQPKWADIIHDPKT